VSPPIEDLRGLVKGLLEEAQRNRATSATDAGHATASKGPTPPPRLVWDKGPPETWQALPIGRRPPVGHSLLDEAIQRARQPPPVSGQAERVSEARAKWYSWAGPPMRVGALNVGFTGLKHSLRTAAELLDISRCDVLFLSDMRTSRRKIGRVRQLLEGAVQDEWQLLTDVRRQPCRPMGIGVLLHTSLAPRTQQIPIPRPPGIPNDEWEEAVGGRLFHLQIASPLTKATWWVVGIYQHVAKKDNALKRTRLLQCLAEITERAQRGQYYLLIIGDANAAPEGGRWHCHPRSPLHASDAETLAWAKKLGLRETPQLRRTPTWKACMCPSSAVLDRAWHHPATLQLKSIQVLWAESRMVVDHALVYVDLPLAQAGISYASACRGGEGDCRPSRVRADLTKLGTAPNGTRW